MTLGDKSELLLILEFVGPQLRSGCLLNHPKTEYANQKACPYVQSF